LYKKHRDCVETSQSDIEEESLITVPDFIVEESEETTEDEEEDDQNNNNNRQVALLNTCLICSRTFNSKESLAKHFEQAHKAFKMEGFYESLSKLSYNYYQQYQQVAVPVAAAVTTTIPTQTQIVTGYVIQQDPPPLVQFQTQIQAAPQQQQPVQQQPIGRF
jgi:hypothetical protein